MAWRQRGWREVNVNRTTRSCEVDAQWIVGSVKGVYTTEVHIHSRHGHDRSTHAPEVHIHTKHTYTLSTHTH